MKAKNIIAGAILCVAPTIGMAQIPVTDGASIAQAAANFMQQITQMKNQLEQMKNQYKALQNQYDAMTGSEGYGRMLSGATNALEQNLPRDWGSVYDDAMNDSSGMSGQATDMTKQFKRKIDNMKPQEALAYIKKKRQQKGAYDRVMTQKAYDNQMRELNNIEALTRQIDSASTMKEISDLQARIQTAQGSIQAEQVKLQQMAMLQRSQDKLLRMQHQQAVEKYVYGDGSFETPDITVGN